MVSRQQEWSHQLGGDATRCGGQSQFTLMFVAEEGHGNHTNRACAFAAPRCPWDECEGGIVAAGTEGRHTWQGGPRGFAAMESHNLASVSSFRVSRPL